MKIYVIRHGRTAWNEKGLMQGRSNIGLSPDGKKESFEIKEKLSDVSFDICITSPLKRTIETANIVVNNKCKIVIDDLLIERDLGAFEGKKYDSYFVTCEWTYKNEATFSNVSTKIDGGFVKKEYFTIIEKDGRFEIVQAYGDN